MNKFKVGDKVIIVKNAAKYNDSHNFLLRKGHITKILPVDKFNYYNYEVRLEGSDFDVSFYEEELTLYTKKNLKVAKILYG